MNAEFRGFLTRLAGAAAMTLGPVVLVAFLSMPLSLGHHPGESRLHAGAPAAHMT
jgi:hypothetical protein